MLNLASFWKRETCGQIVLPDRSILVGQKMVENAKSEKFKWDILCDFQTMCARRGSDNSTLNFESSQISKVDLFLQIRMDAIKFYVFDRSFRNEWSGLAQKIWTLWKLEFRIHWNFVVYFHWSFVRWRNLQRNLLRNFAYNSTVHSIL